MRWGGFAHPPAHGVYLDRRVVHIVIVRHLSRSYILGNEEFNRIKICYVYFEPISRLSTIQSKEGSKYQRRCDRIVIRLNSVDFPRIAKRILPTYLFELEWISIEVSQSQRIFGYRRSVSWRNVSH